MIQGKLGLPRPFKLGIQFSTSAYGRNKTVDGVITSEYKQLAEEMIDLGASENAEVSCVCYKSLDGEWTHSPISIGMEELTHETDATIDDLFKEVPDKVINNNYFFGLHTHPTFAEEARPSMGDMHSVLRFDQHFTSNKYLGSGILTQIADDIVATGMTTPNKDLEEEDLATASSDIMFLKRLDDDGKVDSDGNIEDWSFDVYYLRRRTMKNMEEVGYQISNTIL